MLTGVNCLPIYQLFPNPISVLLGEHVSTHAFDLTTCLCRSSIPYWQPHRHHHHHTHPHQWHKKFEQEHPTIKYLVGTLQKSNCLPKADLSTASTIKLNLRKTEINRKIFLKHDWIVNIIFNPISSWIIYLYIKIILLESGYIFIWI